MSDFDLWMDFNDITREGLGTSLMSFAEDVTLIRAGETITVGDWDGNLCRGVVRGISDYGVVTVALDLESMANRDLPLCARTCTCRHGAPESDPAPYWTALNAAGLGGAER